MADLPANQKLFSLLSQTHGVNLSRTVSL